MLLHIRTAKKVLALHELIVMNKEFSSEATCDSCFMSSRHERSEEIVFRISKEVKKVRDL